MRDLHYLSDREIDALKRAPVEINQSRSIQTDLELSTISTLNLHISNHNIRLITDTNGGEIFTLVCLHLGNVLVPNLQLQMASVGTHIHVSRDGPPSREE